MPPRRGVENLLLRLGSGEDLDLQSFALELAEDPFSRKHSTGL
jgi:hypothetical protein